MGAKGRDIVLWLYLVFSCGGLLKRALIYPAFVCLFALGYFYFIERPGAIKYRQIILLPVNKYLTRLLIRDKVKDWDQAYEVHINFTGESIKSQLQNIQQDIKEIISNRPGLYIFETHIHPFKKELGDRLKLHKNGPFIPRPPLAYRQYPKNRLCHGAVRVNKDRGENYA